MQSRGVTKRTINAQFDSFRSGDGADIRDVIARLLIVMVCGVALWFVTDQLIMLAWCVGYWMMSISYVFGYLRRKSGDATRNDIAVCITASFVIAAWYCSMAVYIATLRDGDFVFLAACAVLGLALHCLSRNVEFSYTAYIDFIAVIVTGIGVTIMAAINGSTPGAATATLIGGLCSCIYFWLSFHKVISVNLALAEKTREDTQNQKMLALGQLASGVAHDFNNLLTVISGNIELVMLDLKSRENKEFLTEAQTASEKSAVLVRQLLAYGRKSELRVSKVDLDALFNELEVLLSRVLPAHIHLEILGCSLKQDLLIDKALLESAVMNLVINAQKAIGDQPGTVQLSAEPDPSQNCICIHVTDTGPGMTPEVLTRAAEPFFTTRTVGQGSGLGLSMVNGFATQSGGNLSFANLKTGGFRATITLPISH